MDFSQEPNLEPCREGIWRRKGPVDLPLPSSVTFKQFSVEYVLRWRDIFPPMGVEQGSQEREPGEA